MRVDQEYLMNVDIYQVDSFTSEIFKGNPAGVCITEKRLSDSIMLKISKEMAVSETAFLSLDSMQLRWFTPKVEVNLCGHGTLATAHVLKEIGLYTVGDIIKFNTLSGVLKAELAASCIHLFFPAPILNMHAEADIERLHSLGIAENNVIDYGIFNSKQIIVLDNENILNELSPDYTRLCKFEGRGVLVTAKSSLSVDFASRYFAPWVGVNEDLVTGSAHCALCVYWSMKLNKMKLRGFQSSRRGGLVDVEKLNSNFIKLSGKAIIVLRGQMKIA